MYSPFVHVTAVLAAIKATSVGDEFAVQALVIIFAIILGQVMLVSLVTAGMIATVVAVLSTNGVSQCLGI